MKFAEFLKEAVESTSWLDTHLSDFKHMVKNIAVDSSYHNDDETKQAQYLNVEPIEKGGSLIQSQFGGDKPIKVPKDSFTPMEARKYAAGLLVMADAAEKEMSKESAS